MHTDFGQNLRNLRKKHHLTQQQLGKKCNLSTTAISKYESGAVKPSLEIAIYLANYFNVTLDTLFTSHIKSSVSLRGLTEEQAKIIIAIAEEFHAKNDGSIIKMTDAQYNLIGRIMAEFFNRP